MALAASHVLTSLLSPLLLTFRLLVNCLVKILHAVTGSQRCSTQKEVKTVKDIPGPWPVLPILGTRWIFSPFVGRYNLNKLHEAYHDMFERYGDIVKEEAFGNHRVINTRSADDIQEIIKATAKLPIRPTDGVIEVYRNSRPDRYIDGGLVYVQGERWTMLRRLVTHELISTRTMQGFLPELNTVADDMMSLIEYSINPTSGLMDNFSDIASRLGLESSCVLMLGQRLGFLEKEINPTAIKISQAIHDHFHACRDSFYGLPLWKIFPTPTFRKLVRAEETIYDLISEFVEPAIKLSEETCQIDSVQSVLMSVLQRPQLDIRDKKSSIIDFITAGIHTIGTSLSLLLYQIASHPEVQARLFKELSSVIEPGVALTTKHLSSATYLRACVQESFRILPATPILARVTTSDLELSGYLAPAGTVVLSHMWEACLEEKNFVRAKEYIPERWMPEEATNLGLTPSLPLLIAPFGFPGKRVCPGQKFSEQQLYLVLAKIIYRYEVSCVAPLNLCFEFLLTPHGQLPFLFHDR